jgi:hypothetical protein
MKLSAFCSLISGIISIGVTVFLAAGCRLFSGANKASFWLMAVCLAIVIVIAWKIFYFFLKKIICSSKLLILLEDSGLILFRVKDGNIEFFKKLHRGEKFDDLKLGDVLKEHVFLQTSMVFNEEKVFTVFDPDNPEE